MKNRRKRLVIDNTLPKIEPMVTYKHPRFSCAGAGAGAGAGAECKSKFSLTPQKTPQYRIQNLDLILTKICPTHQPLRWIDL